MSVIGRAIWAHCMLYLNSAKLEDSEYTNFKYKNEFYKKLQIFRRHFLYLYLFISWQETVENYLHRPFVKKKLKSNGK